MGKFELLAILLVILAMSGGGMFGPAIRGLFRGGPRPPSHPLPGDDSKILNRPRRPKKLAA